MDMSFQNVLYFIAGIQTYLMWSCSRDSCLFICHSKSDNRSTAFPEFSLDGSLIKIFRRKRITRWHKCSAKEKQYLLCITETTILTIVTSQGNAHLITELEIIIWDNCFIFTTYASRNRSQLQHRKKYRLSGHYTI